MKPLVVVIMAGGAGTRFWPLSTEERPKQFLALTGPRTLLQMSYDRVSDLVPPEKIFVLTAAAYTDLVTEQLPLLPLANIVGEPCRRDTAGAVCLAALLVEHRFPDHTMVVLTADHVISPRTEFQKAIIEAASNCGDGALYTLGIKPTYPATQFGYLEMGDQRQGGDLPHFSLRRFKEKPSLEVARNFLDSGGFYWNSGMFVWRSLDILSKFRVHLPRHVEVLQPVIDRLDEPAFEAAFASLQPISVDYAILEKSDDIRAVIPNIEWDDVGGWTAAATYLEQDSSENAVRGVVECSESRGNTVFCENEQERVILLGANDMVVVRAGERTLVAHKDKLDEIKAALARLQKRAT